MKIGVDIGGSHVGIGLINENGKIIAQEDQDLNNELKSENYAEKLVETIIDLITKVLDKKNINIQDVRLIGIAIPGTVSDTHIIKAENLHIKNFNIVSEINKFFNIPIVLRNDAKCAAIAEKEYGSLKKYDDAVVQYEKAVKMDPTKTDLFKNISSAYEQKNDYKKAISAYQKYYASLDKEKQTPDLQFQFGRLYYGAGTQPDSLAITVEERKQALMSADSTFHAIAEAAPDSYLGNFWRARANSALDPETTQGLAKPFYEEVAALLESKNDPHYNSALVECYSYLGYYYLLAIENPALKAEAKANKDKSIEYWSKILAIDPANATAKRALDGIK